MLDELITIALQRAFWAQPPTSGLLVPADCGGQYGGNAYRQLPRDHQAVRSQSRRGDYSDNAQAEKRLKVLGAYGRASKLKYLKVASDPF